MIDEFDILQIVGEGWFGKILLTEHRSTQTEMVLKALPKAYTGISDFFREFHYGLHLAAHRNIITTYDVAFETAGFYVFSQEYAPLGKSCPILIIKSSKRLNLLSLIGIDIYIINFVKIIKIEYFIMLSLRRLKIKFSSA